MKLFDLITGIKNAKKEGLHLNTYCKNLNATKGALRSMIFKYWKRVIVKIQAKIITVTRDKVDGIFNIVDNSAGLKFQYINKVITGWATERNLYQSANFAGFNVVIL